MDEDRLKGIGKVRNTVGGAKDTVRDTVKK